MSKKPQNIPTYREIPSETSTMSGEEVVISGISGLFPMSDTVLELKANLFNQINMVEEVNYDTIKHPNLPKHLGKVNNLHKFDAQFFRVTHWQANSLDPLCRKLMEGAFSAIYDSGTNPLSLSDNKLGVFIGSSYSDITQLNTYDIFRKNLFLVSGSSKAVLSNRISYWIDSKAPSFTIDQGCASSMACLELAYKSIKRGDCEAALVGGCNNCVHPGLSFNLKSAGHLCLDGKTKCFDKKGDGYVRSEAIGLLFLQKAKDAKRIYTEIVHIKGKYFTEPDDFLGIRKSENIEKFLQEFYSEVTVSPSEVEYVEACGIGIAEADRNELDAIGRHFAKSNPVKVGCIKSNMGHTEAASGVCAITKICLAYHEGKLPGNLHYNDPLEDIPSVRDGRIQVVTSTTAFNRGFTALNCFSYTGANYHCLFKGHYKVKEMSNYRSNIPRLILLSGREENGLNKVMDMLINQPINPEQISLLHNIYKSNIPSHTGRSYLLLDTNEKEETECLAKSCQVYSGTSRPVWFLYSGMGSQWCGMGTELLKIPLFAAAIERCRVVLEPLDIDILNILTGFDESMFKNNITYSMVAIVAMQIGLTDVLKAIGIVADNYIGHSLGETGCAYADGCLTVEETILLSYFRGIVSTDMPLVRGSMAAVGLGYKDILPLCPPEIDVACHNSASSSTLSGPADIMNQFVSDLVSQGIFAKEVPCSNIAYHSRYVHVLAPKLMAYLKKLIRNPKLRSHKWISTLFLKQDWEKDTVKYASAEYFTSGVLNPVVFEENATAIPNNAIVIEIAPHGLLQSIIRRSHSTCTHISLTKRGCPSPINFLLEALGKLHQEGFNLKLEVLYPKVEFPVSTCTPLLSHLVEWEHSTDWPILTCQRKTMKLACAREVVISLHDDDYKFIKGYARNGVYEFPESALLVLVWKTLGMRKGYMYTHMSISFKNIIFHNRLEVELEDVIRLRITIENTTNRFEVINRDHLIVSGLVESAENEISCKEKDFKLIPDDMTLKGDILYNILSMKGYSYSDEFHCIHSINTQTNAAYIKWNGEWVTFLDSLLQVSSFSRNHDGVSTPKVINNLSIQVDEHKKAFTTVLDTKMCYKSEMLSTNSIRCGGIQIDGVIFNDNIPVKPIPDVILSRKFIPENFKGNIDINTAFFIIMQLVANNVYNNTTSVTEILTSKSESMINIIKMNAEKNPFNRYDVKSFNIDKHILDDLEISTTNLFIAYNANIHTNGMLSILIDIIKKGAFVLTLEENIRYMEKEINYNIITQIPVENNVVLILLKKGDPWVEQNLVYITIDHDIKFSWLRRVFDELHKRRRVILVSKKHPACGLLGLIKCLRQDKHNQIRLVTLEDNNIPSFSPDNAFYKQQLEKNLAVNVYTKGQWGNYYYVPEGNTKLITSMDVCLTSSWFDKFENLIWMEKPKSNEYNIIKVHYAGLSSRDCLKAIGKVTHKSPLFGMDFSGTNGYGDRVMGLVSDGAIGSTIKLNEAIVWPVPNHWSLEDAATVPLPYMYAYYCLAIKGKIEKNQTVFVTSGAEAFGQAVISVCLSFGINVYTSVRDKREHTFLLKLFPALKDENIICSGHETLVDKVIERTNNAKCNLVINSSTGYFREAAMECVAFIGLFLDVTETDMRENMNFGMYYLTNDKSYRAVNISAVFDMSNNDKERKVLQRLVADGILTGAVRPLSRVIFSPLEISRAFRLVSSKIHRGKVLVKMNELATSSSRLNVIPSSDFSEGTHIIVCDKGNLGINIIDFLVCRGAKNILVHLQSRNEYLLHKLTYWNEKDVNIEINSVNLQTKEGCNKLINAGKKLGCIKSIFIVHNYKEKVPCENFENDFKLSYLETFMVTANLDSISRNICSLSYFAVIGTCSQNLGNEYAMSACDKICEARRNIGLPGFILRTIDSNKFIQNSSNGPSNTEVLSICYTLDVGMKMNYENVIIYNLHKKPKNSFNIDKILELSEIDNTDYNLPLEKLNVSNFVIEKIRLELKPIMYPSEDLLNLTPLRLNKLWNKIKGYDSNCHRGLGVFYNYLDANECNVMDLFVPMKTLLANYEDYGYIDRHKSHLIMIPGFDGYSYTLSSVAERLKIPTVTSQLGPDLIFETIPDMAKYLADQIKLNFEISSRFYLLGYSFGVNVALEVAKIFETEGRTGIIYCLDSSPDALKSQLVAYLGNVSDEQLQNIILEHMYDLMTGQKSIKLKEDLQTNFNENWSTKVDICMRHLRGMVEYSFDFQKYVLESAYNRIKLAKTYECNFKLKSELILIRGIHHPKAEELGEDYNLSKYTANSVRVFPIESDHASAPYNCRISNIINKGLDLPVLEDFKQENLCEFYYTETHK